jgi:two-component system phosphate regulon sensor histidine kinase PhoR
VAAIRASVEALSDGAVADPEAGPALLEAAQRNAERLSRLVDDLLDLSRLDAGRRDLVLVAVEVETVVGSALLAVDAAARAKGIALASDVASGCRVQADAGALEEVLGNLLDNAVKYTPAGGTVTVRASASVGGGVLVVDVADTGIGIPAADRERIFERFYRVDKARSRELGGTGLGLSIVKHLVQNQGGEISVESKPGRGSTFRFTLPRDSDPEASPTPT